MALAAAGAATPTLARTRGPPADLNGFWTNGSGTPLERPARFKSLIAGEAEARAYEAQEAKVVHGVPGDDVGQDKAEWFTPEPPLMRIRGEARASVIVDPPDGKLPYSEAGRRAMFAELGAMGRFEDPEFRPASERCLIGFGTPAGAPMLHQPQTNDAYQFVQTDRFLAIRAESNNDLRVVSLGDAPAPDLGGQPWMGVSRGRWDGDTLVVVTDTFNRAEKIRSLPYMLYISPDGRVTERLRRTGPEEILYRFTVEDPATFTRPWTGELAFRALKAPIYEYACHEGNYSLPNVLAGARRGEAGR